MGTTTSAQSPQAGAHSATPSQVFVKRNSGTAISKDFPRISAALPPCVSIRSSGNLCLDTVPAHFRKNFSRRPGSARLERNHTGFCRGELLFRLNSRVFIDRVDEIRRQVNETVFLPARPLNLYR